MYHGCIERFIDTLYRGVKNDFIEGGGLTFEFFTPALKIGIPPLMMYIKLLVLIGFDLNFPRNLTSSSFVTLLQHFYDLII